MVDTIEGTMPWSVSTVKEQREELVKLAKQDDSNIRELCRRFGVSRTTCYKWMSRISEGLEDRSRRPLRSPWRTSAEVEALVLSLREEHPAWGARKLRRRLSDLGHEGLPSPSTITEVLRRHEKLGERGGQPRDFQRFERERPNELLQLDFKGDFLLQSGERCYPLTLIDDHSRYVLVVHACSRQHTPVVQAVLEGAFATYGLPEEILCDNSPPWASASFHKLAPLSVWLMQLGVEVHHGRVYHPQTQGKLERFHRSLKAEVLQGRTFSSYEDCQRSFDAFRHSYNHHRPHEALELAVPSTRYRVSPRSFPCALLEPEYESTDEVRKVQKDGTIGFRSREYSVPKCLAGQRVGLRPSSEDGVWEVRFFRTIVAQVNLRYNRHD
jgi:transposase InsO family protein